MYKYLNVFFICKIRITKLELPGNLFFMKTRSFNPPPPLPFSVLNNGTVMCATENFHRSRLTTGFGERESF